jgi:hypothetical protein
MLTATNKNNAFLKHLVCEICSLDSYSNTKYPIKDEVVGSIPTKVLTGLVAQW